jgi:predicted metal-dependent HD superfamily phosphohydrolase
MDWPASWAKAWRGARAAGGGEPLRDALLARYAEPHRHYHTQQHLAECLGLLDDIRTLATDPAAVELALWFHDAIYDVPGQRNEERSADWAFDALQAAGARDGLPATVRRLVLCTRHDAVPDAGDERLVVDIDLAILGAGPERFAEYERQIRAEYAHVPEPLFRSKRGEILRGFLARPAIYGTAAFRQRFEATARRNLQGALL